MRYAIKITENPNSDYDHDIEIYVRPTVIDNNCWHCIYSVGVEPRPVDEMPDGATHLITDDTLFEIREIIGDAEINYEADDNAVNELIFEKIEKEKPC
jgi:hypothetical protein